MATDSPGYKRAIVKFNSGRGALLCNRCNIILKVGFDHEDREHYCEEVSDAVSCTRKQEAVRYKMARDGE